MANPCALLFCAGMTLIGFYGAWMYFFNPDKAWEWQESSARRTGLEPVRTPEWEGTLPIRGVARIILGFIGLGIMLVVLAAP